MIVKPSIKDLTSSPVGVGSLVETSVGYRLMITQNGEYAFINLSGEVTSNWYNSPQSLLNGYTIELMIPNDNLTLGYIVTKNW